MDDLQTLNAALDKLIKLRRKESRNHSDEVLELMREKERWRQETLSLREEKAATDNKWKAAPQKMLDKRHIENEKVAQLFRDHLDDSANDMENDNEWEQEARKITWNY